MAIRDLPPIEFLRECFTYSPETGELTWRARPDEHYASATVAKAINSRQAGKPALAVISEDGYLVGHLSHEGSRRALKAHRVIFKLMTGRDPGIIDHINSQKRDNRWANLREVTISQSNMNRRGWLNRDLPKGVTRCDKYFYADYKQKYLGRFKTPEEAHAAYCKVAKADQGEFFNSGD